MDIEFEYTAKEYRVAVDGERRVHFYFRGEKVAVLWPAVRVDAVEDGENAADPVFVRRSRARTKRNCAS